MVELALPGSGSPGGPNIPRVLGQRPLSIPVGSRGQEPPRAPDEFHMSSRALASFTEMNLVVQRFSNGKIKDSTFVNLLLKRINSSLFEKEVAFAHTAATRGELRRNKCT